jgi:hypothetical protein
MTAALAKVPVICVPYTFLSGPPRLKKQLGFMAAKHLFVASEFPGGRWEHARLDTFRLCL